jgi:hypothetical protein
VFSTASMPVTVWRTLYPSKYSLARETRQRYTGVKNMLEKLEARKCHRRTGPSTQDNRSQVFSMRLQVFRPIGLQVSQVFDQSDCGFAFLNQSECKFSTNQIEAAGFIALLHVYIVVIDSRYKLYEVHG